MVPLCQEVSSSSWKENQACTKTHGLAGEGRVGFQPHLLLVCTVHSLTGKPNLVPTLGLVQSWHWGNFFKWMREKTAGQLLLPTTPTIQAGLKEGLKWVVVMGKEGNGQHLLSILDTLLSKKEYCSYLRRDNSHKSRLPWTTGTCSHPK